MKAKLKVSSRPDRIRAAIIALENWDTYRKQAVLDGKKTVVKFFFMDAWFSENYSPEHKSAFYDYEISSEMKKGCGTSACAAGFLGLILRFQQEGLVTTKDDNIELFVDGKKSRSVAVLYKLARFFDVTESVAQLWFTPNQSRFDVYSQQYIGPKKETPADVANLMRAYLREIGEETGTVAPRELSNA